MTDARASFGPLTVRQGELASTPLRDAYDLCIAVCSWETRASAAFEQVGDVQGVWEVWSFASGDADKAEAKAACFDRLTSVRNGPLAKIELDGSLKYERNFELIEDYFRSRSQAKGGPLDVLLDMTCLPKKYMLFVLGMALRNEFVRAIDFVYSEGRYRAPVTEEVHGPMTWSRSDGDWASVQVPYLEADNFIPDARGLIVSLGAEISASVPFIERYEPLQIALVSVKDEASRIDPVAIEAERRLLRELETLPITTSVDAALEDVLGVARLCRSFCEDQPDMAVTGLAIGSKPHALGLGLAALAAPNLEIVCRLPSRYLSGDVVATGRTFVYAVEDRFEPR
ncbi:hypothetical protein EGY25_09165 [Brevundimonas intermedia]|uniref:Uncharacterized protein n=1 Tax=Brevundimonas intermedia TaxID=74315 RepID=A0A4Y9RTH0_9CAUL|nr:hypothetical protein [Brevundimonas intermedia]TFW12202.1 hypothetical protein EGY25_09165 [Brevundimonas intermedia]